ncbi:uncharacterized protein EV422DRAFT_568705 [Fimicolochytrium jonesii]|uniref:uncharacterized protein n=1 Tax=Fimicolochytrium jonesii TaxID=1396493 RepID=UPI0022FE3054|nr:uncharacterized protein EV422DRAFT_568705 [Fimicolochytrium jonesii]KAI8819743.1 hypothetical protein EV422DRAFT_568705 [Fimicolochytrium jonesii]
MHRKGVGVRELTCIGLVPLYRFTAAVAGDDGLLLGEAVVPLAQRGRIEQGQLKVKLGPHIDVTKLAALGAKGLCRNCPKVTEEVMKVIISHRNTTIQEWSRTGTPGEESEEEFA